MSQTNDRTDRAWDASGYDNRHSYVWKHCEGLIDLLAPRKGERILDLGCGTGHLTAQIAESGAEVVGIDRSPEMIEQASKNYPAITFHVADAADFRFEGPFDAVFSNAVLHWIHDKEAVVRCVCAALKPGGRFVVEFGGRGNIHTIQDAIATELTASGYPEAAARKPWQYMSVGEFAPILERHGLLVTFATLFDRLTLLDSGEEGMRNWIAMFAKECFAGIPQSVRDAVVGRIEERVRPMLYRDSSWYADYRRLRVVAVKE